MPPDRRSSSKSPALHVADARMERSTDKLLLSTFVVLGENGVQDRLVEVDFDEQPRKKRVHRKSRQGCAECKRRRVKASLVVLLLLPSMIRQADRVLALRPTLQHVQCDENFPCSNCVKRCHSCVRPPPRQNISPGLPSPRLETSLDPAINLLHLQMFHHFEKHTVGTLSIPQIWPEMLKQAFHVRLPNYLYRSASAQPAALCGLFKADVTYAGGVCNVINSLRRRSAPLHPMSRKSQISCRGSEAAVAGASIFPQVTLPPFYQEQLHRPRRNNLSSSIHRLV